MWFQTEEGSSLEPERKDKMCCTSLHLIIGVLLVLNVVVENEAMALNTEIDTSENTTTPGSELHGNDTAFNGTSMDFTNNFNLTSNSTDALPNTTVENTTPPKSDFSASPPEHHPQPSQATTEDPSMSVTETTTKKMPIKTSQTPKSTEPEPTKNYGSAYIIILVIIIGCIIGILIYCCLQKKSRRYSVDLHAKQEDAQIPLSAVDAEVFDSASVKDMQTFSPVESSMPIKDPEPVKEAEKPEGDKEAADVKKEDHENLSDAQAIVISEDKEVELTIVDLTDGEMAISTKTSMESLDEPFNENNNNNTGVKDL